MIISDLLSVPGFGTAILIPATDPDLETIQVGTRLQQGSTIWTVNSFESASLGKAVSLLLKPVSGSGSPARGAIQVLP